MINPTYKYRTRKRRQKRFPLQASKTFNKNTARIKFSSKVLDYQRQIPNSVTEEKGFQYCVNCTFQPTILNCGSTSNISIMCEHVYTCTQTRFLTEPRQWKKLSACMKRSVAQWKIPQSTGICSSKMSHTLFKDTLSNFKDNFSVFLFYTFLRNIIFFFLIL